MDLYTKKGRKTENNSFNGIKGYPIVLQNRESFIQRYCALSQFFEVKYSSIRI